MARIWHWQQVPLSEEARLFHIKRTLCRETWYRFSVNSSYYASE